MSDANEEPIAPPQEAAPEAGDGGAAAVEAPAAEAPAEEAALAPPAEADDPTPEAPVETGPDPAAAAAAAAAVAARLMAEHGQQAHPTAEGGEAYTNNKRSREDGPEGGDEDGPDKKRGMLNTGHNGEGATGTEPLGFGGMPAGQDPAGGAPGGEMVSDVFEVPGHLVGKLIGRAGETIRTLQMTTDTRIQVDHTGEGPNKRITVSGYTQDQVNRAKATILALDAEETTQTMDCPASVVGRIIGRGGETIRALQSASEAHITVNQDFPADQPRQIVVQGKPQACERAMLMISELIHGEPGSAQAIIQRVCAQHGIGQTDVMTAPKMIVGRIIGRGGETIKQIQKATGATVQIDQGGDPCRITLAGQHTAVNQAKQYITEIMNGGDPFMTGGGGGGGGGMPGFGGYGGAPAYGGGYPQAGGYGGFPPAGGYGGGGGYPGGYGGGYPPQAAYGGYPQPGGDPYAAYGGGGGAQYGAVGSGYPGVGGGDVGGGGAVAGGGAAAGGGGGGWVEYHDEQGRPYYFNAATNTTQWDKPADA